MDLLSKYKQSDPATTTHPQTLRENSDSQESSAVIQWAERRGIKRKQTITFIFGFTLLAAAISFAILVQRDGMTLAPNEEKMFQGKSASQKRYVPQTIDQSLFNQY